MQTPVNTEHGQTKHNSKLPLFALGSMIVALIIFLASFFLTSKAQTPHPRSNLLLAVPEVPKQILSSPRVKLTPMPEPIIETEEPEETTPAAEIIQDLENDVSTPAASPTL